MRATFILALAVATLGFATAAGANHGVAAKTVNPVIEKPTKRAASLPGPAAFAIVLIGVAGVIRRNKH